MLKVISSSPGELKPVFDAILENATRICDAKFGSLQLFEANGYRRAALITCPLPAVGDMCKTRFRRLARRPLSVVAMANAGHRT